VKVEYSATAVKELRKLDKPIQRQIKEYMEDVAALKDPRSRGHALVGNLAGLWRYRVGDFRVVCEIQDTKILITILHIADRKEVYR
jgi:mRNA interferase RelE/StbE